MVENRISNVVGVRRSGWGVDWGEIREIPCNAHYVDSDAAVADLFTKAIAKTKPVTDFTSSSHIANFPSLPLVNLPPVVITEGDLARTLGVGSGALAGAKLGVRALIDVGIVHLDGCRSCFVAHLIARRSWWRGRLLAIANASFFGEWNIAPRAHVGDGKLDVMDSSLPYRVRWAASQRLHAGTHVPHSGISQRRIKEADFYLEPPMDVYLDKRRFDKLRHSASRSRRKNRVSHIQVVVVPSALEVWVPSR